MPYIKKTLTAGERLIILKRRHSFFWLKPFLWSVVLAVAFYGFIFAFELVSPPKGLWEFLKVVVIYSFIQAPVFFIWPIWLCLWLSYWFKYRSKEYAVTTKRVIVKMGFIRIDTDELRNERIENIQIKQSLLGRLFSYGDLEFKGTGGTEVVFLFIADPVDTKKAIESVIFEKTTTPVWRPQIG